MKRQSALRRLRKKQEEDTGTWEIAFADLVTLLLTFFIVLLSISQVDFLQYERVAESMGQALGKADKPEKTEQHQQVISQEEERTQVTEIQPDEIKAYYRKIATLNSIMEELQYQLQVDKDSVSLERRESAIALNLWGGVFFKSGSAVLTEKAVILSIIADALAGLPYDITVEGHTDNVPISTSQFPSNWELSAARAASVARFLIHHGIDENQVKIVGLADTQPLAPNTDDKGNPIPENMHRNRRVVILIEV